MNTVFIVANTNYTMWYNYFEYVEAVKIKLEFIFHIHSEKFAIWKCVKLHTFSLPQTDAKGTFYFSGRMKDIKQQQQQRKNRNIYRLFDTLPLSSIYLFTSCVCFFTHNAQTIVSLSVWMKIPLLNNIWVCWKIESMDATLSIGRKNNKILFHIQCCKRCKKVSGITHNTDTNIWV